MNNFEDVYDLMTGKGYAHDAPAAAPPPNRLVVVWENTTPDNTILTFTSAADAENYYGVASNQGAIAQKFFANFPHGTLSFIRQGLGQRPHLIGANVNSLGLTGLQGISGTVTATLDGFSYEGKLNMVGVNVFDQAALRIGSALDHNLQTAAVTTGSSISSQTVDFTGDFAHAQLTVTSVASGESIVVGGKIDGTGVKHTDNDNRQIIYDHGAGGGPGHYSTFQDIGRHLTPEAMTETYGILTIGAVTSGTIAVGDQVTGAGVPPKRRLSPISAAAQETEASGWSTTPWI